MPGDFTQLHLHTKFKQNWGSLQLYTDAKADII